ncbi:NACHT, LRR and PYD domains-containing protein 3 [Collichthys lucidus]|uniref:NACHT, LRR and PYD domains-containing protein 3 n=1 Tax=Collichthys lucidus TaxID=240159 RepID=A0A4U5U4Y0_COLLU|nr:NACHT, LRR and PYD domains-containing protein 3 [Collichthys lucidus]
MQVPELLVETLEDLGDDDLKKFKWYLTLINEGGCKPIPNARLEKASREETVSRLIERYGENGAVKVTATALRKMSNNNAADMLERAYAAMGTATPSTSSTVAPPAAPAAPAAPATMMAQEGSVIFAPTISSGTSGAWNITINKS